MSPAFEFASKIPWSVSLVVTVGGVFLLLIALLAPIPRLHFEFRSRWQRPTIALTGAALLLLGVISSSRIQPTPPLGSILAWHRDFLSAGVSLPDGWVECNGQRISDPTSPFNGAVLPNLNGEMRFLRGSLKSGELQSASRVAVTLETDQNSLFYNASGSNMTAFNGDFDAADKLGPSQRGVIQKTGQDNAPNQVFAGTVRPINMSVIWIIRIK